MVPYDANRRSRVRARVVNSSSDRARRSRTEDREVVRARSPLLLLVRPRTAEDRVRVRIDEPRHEHPAPTIHPGGTGKGPIQLRHWAHGRDPVADHGHRDFAMDPRVAHLRAAASTGRSRTRHDLCGVHEEEIHLAVARGVRGHAITSWTRDHCIGA